MDRRQFLSSSVAGVTAPVVTPALQVGSNHLTVTEHLDWNWTHELLTMPVTFAPGAVKSESVAVRSDTGHLVAGQLESVKRHVDGSVAEAVCEFYADLPSFATRTWVVEPKTEAPPTDLRIDRSQDGTLVIMNSILAVKLPNGDRSPAAAPLLGVRGFDKTWRGAGRLDGPRPVKGPIVTIEGAGPVLARVRISYEYEEGGKYQVTVELRAGEEVVTVHERSTGVKQAAFVFDFAKAFDRGHWNAHSPSLQKRATDQVAGYQNFAINYQEQSTSTLLPSFVWSLDMSTWFAVHSSNAAIRDWLGFFGSHTDAWRGGRWAGLRVEAGPEGLRVRAPLGDYERHWGIVAARADDALVEKEGATNKCFQAQVRLAQTPLDRVRKLPLDWTRAADSYQPHLLLKPADMAAVRKRAHEDQEFRRLFDARRQAPAQEGDAAGVYLATGDEAYAKAVKDRILPALRRLVQDLLTMGYAYHNNVAIALTRRLRRLAVDWDLVAASESVSDRERRWADAAFAFLNCEITDPNYWPPDERGFEKGNINFYSDHYTCVGAIACLLTAHPRRAEWLQWMEGLLNDEFLRWTHASGAWEEAPNYQGATMLFLIPMVRMLRSNGYRGFTQADSLKATMRFLGDIQTPYDPRRKTAMLPTVGDTTFSFHSQSLQNVFAWAARTYADDPQFASRMMWHWKQGGALLCGVHDPMMIMGRWTSALIMVDPAIPTAAPVDRATSKRLDGYGVRLATRNAAGEETYLLVKCGPARNHYDPDELSFHYYARGVPLALDYGCMYLPNNSQPWYHNRISIDHMQDRARGEIADFVALDAADYFAGQLVIDSLTEVPETPDEPYGRAYEKPWVHIRPAGWTRQILVSRAGDYFVVADTIDSDLASDWSLHVLANGIRTGENVWQFPGQLGVDLELYSDGQPNDKVVLGKWGYSGITDEGQRKEWSLCTLDLPIEATGETQHFVRVRRPAGHGYRFLITPRKPGDPDFGVMALPCGFRIKSNHWSEWAFLSEQPTSFDSEGIGFRGRAGLVRQSGDASILCLHSGDRIAANSVTVEACGPISVRCASGSIAGVSRGSRKRVSITWPKADSARPSLLVDGRAYPSVHDPVMAGVRPHHLLIFTLPEGEHRFDINSR